jgi:hypothetical protein
MKAPTAPASFDNAVGSILSAGGLATKINEQLGSDEDFDDDAFGPEDEPEVDTNPEAGLCELLRDALAETGMVKSVETFEAAGIMTRNSGLIVRLGDGTKFQVTVVHDNRGY